MFGSYLASRGEYEEMWKGGVDQARLARAEGNGERTLKGGIHSERHDLRNPFNVDDGLAQSAVLTLARGCFWRYTHENDNKC